MIGEDALRSLETHLRDRAFWVERTVAGTENAVESWPVDTVPLRNMLQHALAARLSGVPNGPVLLAAIERFAETTLAEMNVEEL